MKFFIVSLCMFILVSTHSQVSVFESGADGYKSYRIPAIIGLKNGTLLAFCEGRINGSNDFGNIDIVMKRSNDQGKTWMPIQIVVNADSLQAGNPAPVLDNTDPAFPGGRIFLFYNTGNNHEGEVRKGHGLREVWYKTSTDNGQSWSDPVNITAQVHRPKQPQLNPSYNFSEDWRSYANTPGHAMQFSNGKYKGRIYVAANRSAGEPQKKFTDYNAFGYYTDDHGKNFRLSDIVKVPGSNESMATELSGDRLTMNSRDQRARIVSLSSNGGQSWDSSYVDTTLVDPVNQGSILTLGMKKGKAIVAFCNAADDKRRDNLTLRISYDEGAHWTENIPVDRGADGKSRDFTAYSDLVILSKKTIGVLYERDSYKQIAFITRNWK